jgi:hypothetical protein
VRGYVLYRDLDGSMVRVEAERRARRALRRVLEDSVPGGFVVLGLVLGEDESDGLHLVA